MSNARQHSKLKYVVLLAIAGVSVFAALWLFTNRQLIVDQIGVWQYSPSGEITSFAARSGMSDKGKFYFYTSRPSIENATGFNSQCGRAEKSTAILGCYSDWRIYIYNVRDPKLDGIREVTAAHEMLHAAYARLNDADKQAVNTMLEVEYKKLKDDDKFAERMAFYARTEPGERGNELHSIIGTEVETISPALERYYDDYFSDRGKVVALYVDYAGVFLELHAQSDALAKELADLGDKIESDTIRYNKDISQFNADVEEFKQRIDSGDFTDESQYQAERSTLLARADELDARRSAIDSDVTQYESLRIKLQGIASQSEALNRSIDSSLAPAPSL